MKNGAKHFFVEACSNAAGEDETFTLIVREEESSEILSGTLRQGVTDNDKFLILVKLDFDPGAGAMPGFVSGSSKFGDGTFKIEVLHFL